MGCIETEVRVRPDACVGIALASEGYPPAPGAARRRDRGTRRRRRARGRPRVPRRHRDARGRSRHERRSGADRHRDRADDHGGARSARTRPPPSSRGPDSTTVATSPPEHFRDPALRPPRDCRPVHGRGALRRLVGSRDPRGRSVGRARGGAACRRRRDSRATPDSTSMPYTSASASPTTTSPRSSTWCRNGSGVLRARGCTTGSPRATSSTPPSRCR